MKRKQIDRNTTEPGSSGGSDPRRWKMLWVIVTAQLLIVLDANIVNIALPSAQAALGMSDGDRQWVVTAYSLTSAASCCSAAGWPTCMAARRPSSRGWWASR
ncbi:hypothetical protein [Nonomuraea sp. NPDC048901]|uniref:hypothetical protein n=1 Tax=Nonomuraea sp. NPDC048901 TaxID=3155627 RepID=UPI0033E9355A